MSTTQINYTESCIMKHGSGSLSFSVFKKPYPTSKKTQNRSQIIWAGKQTHCILGIYRKYRYSLPNSWNVVDTSINASLFLVALCLSQFNHLMQCQRHCVFLQWKGG